jgi:hypothetical protein
MEWLAEEENRQEAAGDAKPTGMILSLIKNGNDL